jgi:type II secretory pathway component HofQ
MGGMMRLKLFFVFVIFAGVIFFYSRAQEPSAQNTQAAPEGTAATATPASDEGLISSLKFKEADINIVLQAIAQKALKNGKKVNIVIAPEVQGTVTIDLKDVYWATALDAVL